MPRNPDRETVIRWLTNVQRYTLDGSEGKQIMAAAIELLKGEPIKPKQGLPEWRFCCGNCASIIVKDDKFCHECGRAVKWD